MGKSTSNTVKIEELILSGDAAKDFNSFFKSKDKPYDFGLQLIERYTTNRTLLNHLKKHKDEAFAKKQLIENLKIIQKCSIK